MPNAAGWHCAMQSDRRMPPAGARRGESASPDPQLTFDWSASPRTGCDAAEPPVSPVHIEHGTEGVPASAAVDPGAHHDGRYGPGHPWHYHPLADNAAPMPADAIPPAKDLEDTFDRELPRRGPKRIVKARELLDAERRGLEADRQRYQALVERGADALSRYDREIAHGGDLAMARASALALTFNHIAWRLGRIAVLERELSRSTSRGR
ncbi:MAG: hypothetical protein BroJett001_32210 [Chloroflexota bacterium]|nr:MAG: hypothetical protein BroJett001_32210 [Chloroflexota bacterium]